MGDVIKAYFSPDQPTDHKDVLESAKHEDMDFCLVIGTTKDGTLYRAATHNDLAAIFYWMEVAKKHWLDEATD